MKRLTELCGWSLTSVLLAPAAAAQAVVRVPAGAPTIQDGIALAQDGDTVLVAPGTYAEAIDFLGKALRVVSEAGAAATTIDATGLGSPVAGFFADEGPDSVLRGFTLTGGDWDGGPGAGISCYGFAGVASPLIQQCVIRDNQSGVMPGAGVAGEATLEDCVIESNYTAVGSGGGVYGAPILRRCLVRWNSAYDAGGLYLLGGSLEDCQIVENYGGEGASAGGVTIAGDGVVLTRCVVARNISSGIFLYRVKGAGVHVTGGVQGASLVSCTIVGNNVADSGPTPDEDVGGIFGSPTLVDTILYGNDFLELEGGSPLSATFSDIEGGWSGPGNFSADPLFVDFAGGDYHLQAGSPCIDSGDPAAPLDPDCTRRDVGAFHFAHPCVQVANGSGANPLALVSLTDPVVGSTWYLQLDATVHPGTQISVLLGRLLALQPGVVYSAGELLVFGPKLFTLLRPSSGGLDVFAVQIPPSASLIGFEGYVQGALLRLPGDLQLTNALRMVLGQ